MKLFYSCCLLFLMISLTACKEDDEEKIVALGVSDISLVDLGYFETKNKLEFNKKANAVHECNIRTYWIRKGDEIVSVKAERRGEIIGIRIVTTSGDSTPPWDDETRFSLYDLKFTIAGIDSGVYTIDMGINNTGTLLHDRYLE